MTQTELDELEALHEHVRALIASEHILGHEKGELRRIRDRLETRLSAIRRGEALRPERAVPGNDARADTPEPGEGSRVDTTTDTPDTSTAHPAADQTTPVTRLGHLRALKTGELAHMETCARELHDAAVSTAPVFSPERVKVLFDAAQTVIELHQMHDLIGRDLGEMLTGLLDRIKDENVASTAQDLFGSGLPDMLAALLSDVHLVQEEQDLTDRIKRGMLTPAGRKELEQQLKTVRTEIDHLEEVAALSARFQS